MASIRQRGNSYLITVSMGYDHEGNRIKPAQKTVHPPEGLTPKQVEKWLNEQAVLFEREAKNEPQPVNRSMTLAKFVEHWQKDVAPAKLALTTLNRANQDIPRILLHLGHYKLTDLNLAILREFYDAMRLEKNKKSGKPLMEKTVEGIHGCLCGILSDAVEEGYLIHNPAWGAYKRKGRKQERFTADEELAARLINCLEQESFKYEVYFKLVLFTGMRRGECCGIKWQDVNWKKSSLDIRRNIVKVPHLEIMEKDPKTDAGVRTIYLSKAVTKLLRAYQKECRWFAKQYLDRELQDNDFVFLRKDGLPMTPGTFTYRFRKILKKYELPRELTIHSLRHTNASLLISQNIDVRTVANMLGHAQPSTTLDIYSHAFDKNKKAASKKLEEALDW